MQRRGGRGCVLLSSIDLKKRLLYFVYASVHECACVCANTPQHRSGGQRTTCRNWFFPSTKVAFPGDQTHAAGPPCLPTEHLGLFINLLRHDRIWNGRHAGDWLPVLQVVMGRYPLERRCDSHNPSRALWPFLSSLHTCAVLPAFLQGPLGLCPAPRLRLGSHLRTRLWRRSGQQALSAQGKGSASNVSGAPRRAVFWFPVLGLLWFPSYLESLARLPRDLDLCLL